MKEERFYRKKEKRKRDQSRCREKRKKKKEFQFRCRQKEKKNIINLQLFHSLQRNCESCESCINYNHTMNSRRKISLCESVKNVRI